jgi:hypothetical protein
VHGICLLQVNRLRLEFSFGTSFFLPVLESFFGDAESFDSYRIMDISFKFISIASHT